MIFFFFEAFKRLDRRAAEVEFVCLQKKCRLRRFFFFWGGRKKNPDSAPCFHNNSRSFQLTCCSPSMCSFVYLKKAWKQLYISEEIKCIHLIFWTRFKFRCRLLQSLTIFSLYFLTMYYNNSYSLFQPRGKRIKTQHCMSHGCATPSGRNICTILYTTALVSHRSRKKVKELYRFFTYVRK